MTTENQGKGFGSKIFDALVAEAIADGNTDFALRTAISEDNARARGLYERRGFADTGIRSLASHKAVSQCPEDIVELAKAKEIVLYREDEVWYVRGERMYMEMSIGDLQEA